jgi:hypothetical protein
MNSVEKHANYPDFDSPQKIPITLITDWLCVLTPVNFNYALNQLGSDDVIPNRKPDEIGIVFSMKHFHYPVLVKRYCAETNVEDGTNILHPFSFCQQMQDLALPLGQLSYLFHAPPVFNTAHVSRQGNTGKFDRIDQGRLVVGLPRSFIGEKSP